MKEVPARLEGTGNAKGTTLGDVEEMKEKNWLGISLHERR